MVEMKLNWFIPGKNPPQIFCLFSELTKLFIFLSHHSFWDRLGLGAAGLGNVWFLRDPQSGYGLHCSLFVLSIWFERKHGPTVLPFEAPPRKMAVNFCNSLFFSEELEGKKRQDSVVGPWGSKKAIAWIPAQQFCEYVKQAWVEDNFLLFCLFV